MTRGVRDGEAELAKAVLRARTGDRQALERVVIAVQHDVFRLALRMTADPHDAEDASQEILIKVITRLDGFRGASSVRTWAYRIAVRHLLDRRKSAVEALALDFECFGADLLDGLSVEPDPDPAVAEQVKLGCTLAMLTCLDREHRVAYVLADVFDLPHADAAEICEISEDALRQRLSRARRALEAFTSAWCGLVDRTAPCQCSRRVARAEELGRVHRDRRLHRGRLEVARNEMESLHTAASLMRAHPAYRAPARLLEDVRAIVKRDLALWRSTGDGGP